MTAPEKFDNGIVPSRRAQEGLRMLGEDISNYLNDKKEDIKTTGSKNGAIINNVYNYPSRAVSTKYGFVRTVWITAWMIFTIIGVYIILSHPEWIVSFGDWLRTVF